MSFVRESSRPLVCALIAGGLVVAPTAHAAKPARSAKSHRFDIGGVVFAGSAKTICVIEGRWRNGEPFRFEAWDECSEMRVRRPLAGDLEGARSLGANRDYTVADIPAGTEVLEVSNGYSSVLLFRDGRGVMREILTRD